MMTDAEIMEQVRSGKVLKYCGRGVVVINYGWWVKLLEKTGFRIVPTLEDMMADRTTVIDSYPTVGGWISVKKKLPDVDGLYLVYGMTDAMRELLPNCVPIWLCNYYQEHGFYSFSENMRFDYITHWMPMPEPPKEDV